MKFCPNCGSQQEDASAVCTQCGSQFAAPAAWQQQFAQQMGYGAPVDIYDHTAEFDQREIAEGKVFALAIYLLPVFGVFYALIGATGNKFIMFHVRTWLKLTVVSALCAMAAVVPVLGWIVAGVWQVINFVLTLICFFNVCKGKAIDPPIIRGLGFLN